MEDISNQEAVMLTEPRKETVKKSYPGKKKSYGYDDKWFSVYWYRWNKPQGARFVISPASYFDNRAQISICLFWVQFYINLPIYSTWDDCEYPEYGFYYFNNSLVIEYGYGFNKKKFVHMPWELDWVRTSRMKKDGTWDHELRGGPRKQYNEAESAWEKENLWTESHPYKYVTKGGELQDDITATIRVEEREWRPRAFRWTKLFARTSKTITVDFDKEVGNQRGSWKGGTVGCSYTMLPGESPYDTLKRMEKERSFCR